MNKKWVLLQIILLIPIASALDSNYNIIVEENGNSLVIIELEGEGLINIPLPEDVNDVRVKGALYAVKNNSVDISIGSTQKAIVLYKTSMLTTKQDNWNFKINLVNTQKEKVTLAIPKEAVILETHPGALIESLNYTKLIWEGHIQSIEVEYEFPEVEVITLEDIEKKKESKSNMLFIPVIFLFFIIILILSLIITKSIKKTKKKSSKPNIIKTLSKNESLIVKILIDNKGEMKRNILEKNSKLAKSSLANTLNNLERKKIIEIDKTFTTHFIKFTRWFDEL